MKRWPTKPLGELCDVVAGGTPSRARPEFYGGKIPWVKIGDMLQGQIKITEETITSLGLENSAAKLLPAGTVLISIFATIGRTAVLEIEAATNQAIAGVTPKNIREITPSFLRHFLDFSVLSLIAEARGVAQLNINGKILKSLPISVPPLEEQKRIVKLLDEADALRKLRAQADQHTANLIPALFHEMFGEVGVNSQWPVDHLGNLVTIEATLINPRDEDYQDLLHIGPDRIERNSGKILAAKTAKEDGLISAKFLFDERDVLYSKIRPNLRKAALPTGQGLCSADMYPIRPGSRLVREFLWAYLLSDYFTDRAVDLSARANMPKLNRTQLNSISAPVPPLSLQKQFAERVREIRELEVEQAASRAKLDSLFQSMLHRAFNGEL